jgi:hypothetical protein
MNALLFVGAGGQIVDDGGQSNKGGGTVTMGMQGTTADKQQQEEQERHRQRSVRQRSVRQRSVRQRSVRQRSVRQRSVRQRWPGWQQVSSVQQHISVLAGHGVIRGCKRMSLRKRRRAVHCFLSTTARFDFFFFFAALLTFLLL